MAENFPFKPTGKYMQSHGESKAGLKNGEMGISGTVGRDRHNSFGVQPSTVPISFNHGWTQINTDRKKFRPCKRVHQQVKPSGFAKETFCWS
jgi:hypothetical protein